MKQINEYQNTLAQMIAVIDGENLAVLDFDSLKKTLVELGRLLEQSRQIQTDLSLLRQDYIGRIAGMEKAIAIAKHRDSSVDFALELTTELEKMSVAKLIQQYGKTQARFKDAFPTSFGFLRRGQNITSGKDINDYR